jgi:hypothetical protein
MVRFFKSGFAKFKKYEDERGGGTQGHKGSGSRGSRGSNGHKGSGSRGSRGSKGHKGSGSRGSRGSKGHKGSGSRGSCGSKGHKGSNGDEKPPEDKGPDATQLKFFYSTVNADGSTSELTEEGFFQFVEVALPEGSTFDDIPLEDATDMVLTDLEERGVEVGEIYQVTVVGTDADGNEAFFDFDLVDDGEGNLSLEPKNEDADLFASLSTGDADEQDAPQDAEDDDEDEAAWA